MKMHCKFGIYSYLSNDRDTSYITDFRVAHSRHEDLHIVVPEVAR